MNRKQIKTSNIEMIEYIMTTEKTKTFFNIFFKVIKKSIIL